MTSRKKRKQVGKKRQKSYGRWEGAKEKIPHRGEGITCKNKCVDVKKGDVTWMAARKGTELHRKDIPSSH